MTEEILFLEALGTVRGLRCCCINRFSVLRMSETICDGPLKVFPFFKSYEVFQFILVRIEQCVKSVDVNICKTYDMNTSKIQVP